MKNFVVTIGLGALLLFFVSCEKDQIIENAPNSISITGTWELKQVQNGMIPTKEYASGNGNVLQFSDSTYERYTNGTLAKSGRYNIIVDTSVQKEVGLVIPSGKFKHRIVFDNDFTSQKTFLEVEENKLTLLSGNFPTDGGSFTLYEKKENNH